MLSYKRYYCAPSNNISIGCRLCGNIVEQVLLDGSEKIENPNAHVDARSFSLRSVIDNGGSLKPSPKIQRSNIEDRDRVDNFVNSNINKFQ